MWGIEALYWALLYFVILLYSEVSPPKEIEDLAWEAEYRTVKKPCGTPNIT